MRHELRCEVGLTIAEPLLPLREQARTATSALVGATGAAHGLAAVLVATGVVAEPTAAIAAAAHDDLRVAPRALEDPRLSGPTPPPDAHVSGRAEPS